MITIPNLPAGLSISGKITSAYGDVLTPAALTFFVTLARQFEPVRQSLLAARVARQKEFDAGKMPDFLPDTKHIRDANWVVAPVPADIQDRRVEITGPTDRKMVINALNSGAKVFMADFEDASTPSWTNLMDGQINLRDAIRKQVDFTADNGKKYSLKEKVAVLKVRPRGSLSIKM